MQISTIKSTVLKSSAKKTVQTNMLIHSHQRITLTLTPIMNSPTDIKCLSLNIRGLNKSVKRRTFFRWLHRQNCSFVFLQETYHSKGIMILVNPKIKCKVEQKICDKNGRYIILDIALADTRVTLVNIYAPNDVKQQVSFFKELQEQLQEFSEENTIIGGDFNCTLSEKDKGGNPSNRKHESKKSRNYATFTI